MSLLIPWATRTVLAAHMHSLQILTGSLWACMVARRKLIGWRSVRGMPLSNLRFAQVSRTVGPLELAGEHPTDQTDQNSIWESGYHQSDLYLLDRTDVPLLWPYLTGVVKMGTIQK